MYAGDDEFGTATRSRLDVKREDVQDSSKLCSMTTRVREKCGNSLASHPVITVLASVVIGVTLGWLVKRR